MKPTELLKKQHRMVRTLFKRVLGESDATTRREICREIERALKMHTTIEEEHFYPAVRELGSRKAEAMVNEALEEHHVVDLVLKELPDIDVEDERFEAKMTVLKELVEHHVEEEEEEMFKLAEKIDSDEQKQLAQRMQEEAQRLEQSADMENGGQRGGRESHTERHA